MPGETNRDEIPTHIIDKLRLFPIRVAPSHFNGMIETATNNLLGKKILGHSSDKCGPVVSKRSHDRRTTYPEFNEARSWMAGLSNPRASLPRTGRKVETAPF